MLKERGVSIKAAAYYNNELNIEKVIRTEAFTNFY
jgi:hypothetical protein